MKEMCQHPHNDETPTSSQKSSWVVYIVRCRDESYYTGITNDLTRRIAEHNSPGGGAKYTRPRRPVVLVYHESAANRAAATRREGDIKRMHLTKKKDLIASASSGLDSTSKLDVHLADPQKKFLS